MCDLRQPHSTGIGQFAVDILHLLDNPVQKATRLRMSSMNLRAQTLMLHMVPHLKEPC